MATQVVEVEETEPLQGSRYEELLARFHAERPPDPRERAEIERQILETFQQAMTEIGVVDEASLANEDLGDLITQLGAVASAGITAAGVGRALGFGVGHVASEFAFLIAGPSGMAISSTVMLIISMYLFYGAVKTSKKLKSAEGYLVQWEKYYIRELDKAEREAADSVQELVKYFVRRQSLLRTKEEENSSTISHELGMQMVRCMHRIERALKRYRELISQGEQTLQAIENHVQVLEEQATRQKRRGWITVMSGGFAVIGGIALIVVSHGAAIPIVVAILGATTATAGSVTVYMSRQQLTKLRSLTDSIRVSKDQIMRHRRHCRELEQDIMSEIRKGEDFVTEAERHSILEAQLEESRRQNEALRRRMEAVISQATQRDHQVQEFLARYRLGKFFGVIVNDLGLETVEDLEEIDEEMLDGIGCKPIDKKKFRKMINDMRA